MKIEYLKYFAAIILITIGLKVQAQSLTWLGTLGGNTSRASCVSDDGKSVAGTAQDSGALYKAFLWKETSGIQNLGTFGGNGSSASGISASGNLIVGSARDSLFRFKAFLWHSGVMSDIGTLGGDNSYAAGISSDGYFIVGDSETSDNPYNTAFSYHEGVISSLGTLGEGDSKANAVSNGSEAVKVGVSSLGNGQFHAFKVVGNSAMQDLGTLPGGNYSSAIDITDNGNIIIGYSNGLNHNDHAFIWTETNGMQDLGTLGGNHSEANGVSNDGRVVVGWSYNESGFENAFIWTPDSGMQNLNTVYANLIPVGGKLTIASDVSSNGRYIVGTGYKSNPERFEAFLLDRGTTTSVEELNILPDQYSLEQNYPNPFNPSTKIRYAIPSVTLSSSSRADRRDEAVLVTLKIYDVLGNEVATLVNEEKPAGVYEDEFNASQLSSGIYFYKLSAGSFTKTKKMTVLK